MRIALVFQLLLLGACEGGFVMAGNVGRKATIERAYQARDACLARNAAADGTSTTDATTLALAVAMACGPETEKLVQASDSGGDTKVAAALRRDSEFRALGFVMKARGQALF
jgi:hypothetical protein